MLKSFSFPSVYEATNMELTGVANNLIDGIKIHGGESDYMVGNLALQEGYSPHKAINSSPQDFEYDLLVQAGLLLLKPSAEDEINLTVGFPYSTYMLYRDAAVEKLTGKHTIGFDASVCGGDGYMKREANVVKVHVIPEIQGCVTAIREGETHEKGNFFMVSLGFGTFEAVMSTGSGLVNRTLVSSHGVRQAVNLFANALSKEFYLSLKTEHQMDGVFQQGSVTVNRIRHDVSEARKAALRMYYNDVVSPNLRRAFSDQDFAKCNKMYIAGGGAYYQDLLDCFNEEFGSILTIEVYAEPEKCASQGYCLYSAAKSEAKADVDFGKMDADSFMKSGRKISAGLDVGNANTCITVYADGE